MTIGSNNQAELLWPGIKEIWGDEYKEWKTKYTEFFEVVNSDKAFEKYQGATGFGLASQKPQGKAATYADTNLGFQKIIDPVTYALGATVTYEMMEDDQYNQINKIPKFLSRSLRQTEEVVAHDVLNNAATSGIVGADGVTLLSTTHPLVDGSATFANTPTVSSDLTQSSLEAAEIAISNFVDDKGLKISLEGKTLVVPTDQRWVAEKILKTEYEVDSANNTVNPIKGRYNLVVTPFLTDPDSWFLITNCETGLIFQRRAKPQLKRDNDFDTLDLKFLTYSRFGASWVNPRSVYGSFGA